MKAVDALIVGAGPAGCAAAIGLARCGYEVALLEKQIFPREKLCGDFLNPVNRPIFRELGVEGQLLAEPHATVSRFRVTSPQGTEADVDFTSGMHPSEAGLALSRARFDQVLLERAVAAGVIVYQGRRIDRLQQESQGGWRVSAGEEEWRAGALIGADGRNSWVARQLGLAGQRENASAAVGFQFRLQVPGAIDGRIEIHLIPGGYAGVVGLGDGTLNVAMAIDKRRIAGRQDIDGVCDGLLGENPHLRRMLHRRTGTGGLRAVYPVHFPARRAVAPGALLVGDAARVTEPVTGEGVYFALRSGLLAAEAIDLALQRGDMSRSGLSVYERACGRVFRRRSILNGILRRAVYRPALLEPLIRMSSRNHAVLRSMVHSVCAP
jgi:geranylgeranyl reductase family protein